MAVRANNRFLLNVNPNMIYYQTRRSPESSPAKRVGNAPALAYRVRLFRRSAQDHIHPTATLKQQ